MDTHWKIIVALVVDVLILSQGAQAGCRFPFEDGVVVERSELIVVGRLDRTSITYVPHDRKASEGRSWEHHAKLVVSEVLKGSFTGKEIPIVIHYGLDPVVRDRGRVERFRAGPGVFGKGHASGVVEIKDTGNSSWSIYPVVEDAEQDNIWFLRKLSRHYDRQSKADKFGIRDPEDVKALFEKDYIVAYMAKDPEKAVKKQIERYREVVERGQDFLNNLDIQKVSEIPDVQSRIRKLIPFFIKHYYEDSNMADVGYESAERRIIQCGEAAGPHLKELFNDRQYKEIRHVIVGMWKWVGYQEAAPFLLGLFNDPEYEACRAYIMDLWAHQKYKGCVDVLIQFLEQQDRFWEKQDFKKRWTADEIGAEPAEECRKNTIELEYCLRALMSIGDCKAAPAVRLTQQRWAIESSQKYLGRSTIVTLCNSALEEFKKCQTRSD